MSMTTIVKNVGTTLVKAAPELLIGFGLIGMLGAVICAAKDASKAKDESKSLEESLGRDLTKSETVVVQAKHYARTAVVYTVSASAIIAALILKNKRYAALAATCALGVSQNEELRKKLDDMQKKITGKSLLKPAEPTAENQADSTKPQRRKYSDSDIASAIPGYGPDLFVDAVTGLRFWADRRTIERDFAVQLTKAAEAGETSVTVRDFYDAIGVISLECDGTFFDDYGIQSLVIEGCEISEGVLGYSISYVLKEVGYR